MQPNNTIHHRQVFETGLVSVAREERFSRVKHDASFPHYAVKYVLEESGIPLDHITHVVFYEKPYLKFERLLENYQSTGNEQ